MTNILMTGNTGYGLAEKFSIVCPQTNFASRENEYDLCSKEGQSKLAVESLKYDVPKTLKRYYSKLRRTSHAQTLL